MTLNRSLLSQLPVPQYLAAASQNTTQRLIHWNCSADSSGYWLVFIFYVNPYFLFRLCHMVVLLLSWHIHLLLYLLLTGDYWDSILILIILSFFTHLYFLPGYRTISILLYQFKWQKFYSVQDYYCKQH